MRSSMLCASRHLLVLLMPFGTACGHPDVVTNEPQLKENEEFICYLGGHRVAQRDGDRLIIEGDLIVDEEDRWCGENTIGFEGLMRTQGRRAPAATGTVWSSSTYGKVWPGGVVPYVIDADFTDDDEGDILAAMDDWHTAVPGVSFRPKTTNDTYWAEFELVTSGCQSGYGRRTSGARVIELTSGCTSSFSVHHEIGHALGLQHEHTRSDRDEFVAVSSTSTNYEIDTGANLFEYDFDSVMHYPFNASLQPQTNVAIPPEVEVGQRDHLSLTDIASMRAMYPESRLRPSMFASSGHRELCKLEGREEDLVTEFELLSTQSALDLESNVVNTAAVPQGDHVVICSARSVFWARDYDYPNDSYDESVAAAPAADVIEYVATRSVRFMNRGLLGSLF